MLQKLLDKGHEVHVRETHQVWCGRIKGAKVVGPTQGFTIPTIEIKVLNTDAEQHGVTHIHGFTISKPERWKLKKDPTGTWVLLPPRQGDR